jgi:hypothetical protein
MKATIQEILKDTKPGDTITFNGVSYRVCEKIAGGWLCQPKGGQLTKLTHAQLKRITYTSANAALA